MKLFLLLIELIIIFSFCIFSIQNHIEYIEKNKIQPNTTDWDSSFGSSIAMNSEWMVIGAPEQQINYTKKGMVYIFKYETTNKTWEEKQNLTVENLTDHSFFGNNIILTESHIFIAAPEQEINGSLKAGSIYIFDYDSDNATWNQTVNISAETPRSSQKFGEIFDAGDNYLFVGDPIASDNGTQSGTVYFYMKNNYSIWEFVGNIYSSDIQPYDNFGSSVAYYDNTLLVGAVSANRSGIICGTVYYFNKTPSGWNQTQQFGPNFQFPFDYFGTSIARFGNISVIGCPGEYLTSSTSGSVYVYELVNSTWQEMKKITPPDPYSASNFGQMVDIYEDSIMINDPQSNYTSGSTGAFFMYAYSDSSLDWQFVSALVPANSETTFFADGGGVLWDNISAIGVLSTYLDSEMVTGITFLFEKTDFPDNPNSSGSKIQVLFASFLVSLFMILL
ncbi:hypothetical protein M0811_02527 [Anaeramoeba ignava]|uniref:Uncharacterized protein n=1 Tax=Anaeramoeba ignava TaxID=1746090 RepID=A0A9Q0LC63_ANAIG|nr:hypothetical protein M0811_02527 [Anaeramoeba ignava]|eukprot:Anaeramoba_ignava/a1654_40.p1 GENE.a1654_40~~a1654_40.p1  ORF type:complete len:447 (+),score=149.29 a1654_40:74-1414(+)